MKTINLFLVYGLMNSDTDAVTIIFYYALETFTVFAPE
jgi:hypothetical protein|tara:strand:- start:22405 stop:22518 length:114 start_codon:yes stop_codon:yes gene_type:complete